MDKLKGFIVYVSMLGLLSAGVWTSSHADVDGDGVVEGIDYVIGVEGEQNIPYIYAPHVHFIAWNTTRTCMGIGRLRQIICENNSILLDTGEPTLVGETFYYLNKFYESMTSFWEGNNIVTKWTSPYAILERIVNLNDERGINHYKLYKKNPDGSTTYLGETGLITVWNDGITTVEGARNYVLTQLENHKAVYEDSFAGLVSPGNLTFKIIYIFDDYVSRLNNFSVLCWDGWNSAAPQSPAIWGTLHLPEPCSLFCEYSSTPCAEHVYAFWNSTGMLQAAIRIEPEVINLKSQGKFTAFITLPAGYNHTDIDISTVECEGAHAISGYATPEFYIAKFNIQDLVGVQPGPAVEFTVTGKLNNGTQFYGTDTVRIISPGNVAITTIPNPCSRRSSVMVNLLSTNFPELQSAPVSLKIYDGSGSLVRILTNKSNLLSANLVWDMRDDSGNVVAPGIYFIRIESENCNSTQKTIVLP